MALHRRPARRGPLPLFAALPVPAGDADGGKSHRRVSASFDVGQVRFPSCWDGKNARTTDHKSHVTYGDSTNKVAQGVSFDCPSTHPIVLPRVFIEVYW
jgi:hypothetical protein